MNKTYVFEGNTTQVAIENGLKELKVSREDVEIRVLEENKKSFFSILAPRVVKVEFTLKENKPRSSNFKKEKKEITISQQNIDDEVEFLKNVLNEIYNALKIDNPQYTIKYDEGILKVALTGENLRALIGYRGEALNSLETLLSAIAKNNGYLLKVSCNVNGYREKRIEVLNELADKFSNNVIKNKKNITLEPMSAYERKIIHTKLQNHEEVKTFSVGEGKNRRVVIALK